MADRVRKGFTHKLLGASVIFCKLSVFNSQNPFVRKDDNEEKETKNENEIEATAMLPVSRLTANECFCQTPVLSPNSRLQSWD